MKIPVETKPALWGVAGGAVALAIVGFSWGGWITGGKAESTATARVDDAVVTALAPVCVDKFEHANEASANLIALKKVDTWSRGEFVEKGGWAAVPGTHSSERVSAIAKACATLLAGAWPNMSLNRNRYSMPRKASSRFSHRSLSAPASSDCFQRTKVIFSRARQA